MNALLWASVLCLVLGIQQEDEMHIILGAVLVLDVVLEARNTTLPRGAVDELRGQAADEAARGDEPMAAAEKGVD